MRRAGKPRTSWAVAASVAAHLAMLAALLTHRWAFDVPAEQPDSPWEHVISVELAPRSHATTDSAPKPTAILSRPPRPGETPLPSPAREPSPTAPPSPTQPAAGAPSALAQAGGGAGVGGDLGAALRRGILGCSNPERLSREERAHCEEKLGAGAKHETVLANAMDPRIRAYYDAVAKAKAPDKPWTPMRAIGAMGIGQEVPRGSNDRLPEIGCAIPFGPGAKPKLPSHWLKLGPCFIAPPKGPLTTEVDITPPDQDLSHPPPRAGPQLPPGVTRTNPNAATASIPSAVSAGAAVLGASPKDPVRDADSQTPRL